MSSKKMLTRVESMASYTEPGPVNLSESVVSQNSLEFESPITTSTEEFMRILERNSNILQIAAEKNKQLEKSKQSADNSAGDEADEAAADLDAPTAQEDDEDTDNSKIVQYDYLIEYVCMIDFQLLMMTRKKRLQPRKAFSDFGILQKKPKLLELHPILPFLNQLQLQSKVRVRSSQLKCVVVSFIF